jgi:pilus assembly protein Flp/PilA
MLAARLDAQTNKQGCFMRSFVSKFLMNESGATAIEYGLIAALISVAIIATVTSVGTKLQTTFTSVSGAL